MTPSTLVDKYRQISYAYAQQAKRLEYESIEGQFSVNTALLPAYVDYDDGYGENEDYIYRVLSHPAFLYPDNFPRLRVLEVFQDFPAQRWVVQFVAENEASSIDGHNYRSYFESIDPIKDPVAFFTKVADCANSMLSLWKQNHINAIKPKALPAEL